MMTMGVVCAFVARDDEDTTHDARRDGHTTDRPIDDDDAFVPSRALVSTRGRVPRSVGGISPTVRRTRRRPYSLP
jgi:hypothetical protein